MTTKTLHYVTPVDYGDFEPAPHYETTAWVQPMTGGLIDTRDVHAQSEPVSVELPDGTTITESPQGLIATRPDGAWSAVDSWAAPVDGAVPKESITWET